MPNTVIIYFCFLKTLSRHSKEKGILSLRWFFPFVWAVPPPLIRQVSDAVLRTVVSSFSDPKTRTAPFFKDSELKFREIRKHLWGHMESTWQTRRQTVFVPESCLPFMCGVPHSLGRENWAPVVKGEWTWVAEMWTCHSEAVHLWGAGAQHTVGSVTSSTASPTSRPVNSL